MHRLFVKFLSAATLGVALLMPPAASAQDAAGARAFLQALADEALATLARDDLTEDQAVAKAKELLRTGFDLPTIARFVAGRYWNIATPEQQREYMTLFEQMVVETYATRFDEYDGSRFRVGEARPLNDTDLLVSSVVERPDGPPINIGWRIRERASGFLIVDVTVEGVSMLVSQRNEFASLIQRNGGRFDALLAALRQRIG